MIFLSYASEDRSRVLPFYDLLEAHSYDPWMDCKKLLGGQNWDYEINTALDRSEIVVVFVSKNSVDKRGYAQREIRLAIDKYNEKLVDDIYIIPVQLDEGDFPHLLKGIQFISASEGDVKKSVLESVAAATKAVNAEVENAQLDAEVHWSTSEVKSEYNGIPGYSTNVNRFAISSSKYNNVKEVADHINGCLAELTMQARSASLRPNTNLYNLVQNEWQRTDTFDAIFSSAQVTGRVLAVSYSLHWYHAGAAHPVHSPRTFNYLLEPVVCLDRVKDLFRDEAALQVLQSETERLLCKLLYESAPEYADLKWIKEGTNDWSSFANFSLTPEGLSVQFSSYQVACYAAGTPSVTISYDSLNPYFSDTMIHALGLFRKE